MATLLITLFAGLVTFLFLGAIIFESPKDRSLIILGRRISVKKFAAGVLIYFMGAVSLITWSYYFLDANDSSTFPTVHVVVQFSTSILLLAAGHAVLRAWNAASTLFFVALGVTLIVAMISLMAYKTQLEPTEGMYMVLGVVQIVGTVFAAAFYVADLIFSSSNTKQTPSERHRTYVE